jgi:hypothetical protein
MPSIKEPMPLEKPLDMGKAADSTPHGGANLNPNPNSETLKTFYNSLMTTPTNNTRTPAINPMRAAFDVFLLLEKEEALREFLYNSQNN